MSVNFTSRPYEGAEDLQGMLDIVHARQANQRIQFPNEADLYELMGISAVREVTRMWITPEDQFAGYALLNRGENYASLVFEYRSNFYDSEIGNEMLDWAEEIYCQEYHGQAREISATVRVENLERSSLLEQHGFLCQTDQVIEMSRDLNQDIPAPVLPEGFQIRVLKGEGEAADWVTLHQAALGTRNLTIEYRLAMMRIPSYDPTLDLVATASDGSMAAYVFCSISDEENLDSGQKIGFTDPVATHPNYQRKGLSRALLLTGLRILKERGIQTARLSTSGSNMAMQKSARSVGFNISARWQTYTKVMR